MTLQCSASPRSLADAVLFDVETNDEFPEDAAGVEIVAAPIAALGLGEVRAAWRIGKRSTTSVVYRLRLDDGDVMLRGADAPVALVAAQCEVARRVPSDIGLVRPVVVDSGSAVAAVDDLVWFAYGAAPGSIYDGRSAPVEEVVASAIALLRALDGVGDTDARLTEALPVAIHRPDRWEAMFAALGTGSEEDPLSAPAALAPATVDAVRRAVSSLRRMAADVAALPPGPTSLVHNDLQHANVVVGDEIRFIDLEDICLEHRGVAAGHALFKLVRHAVRGALTVEDARDRVWPRLAGEAATALGLDGARTLTRHAARRIVSDVFEIHVWHVERGDPSQLYDLEKRMHNLLELIEMTGAFGEPAT